MNNKSLKQVSSTKSSKYSYDINNIVILFNINSVFKIKIKIILNSQKNNNK